ncbi:mechanosensitive ion channel family protein [Flavobacterium sp. CS20]|uniref:mechanosensitive ion channel family protein n=1 Tax=Flavobacterium sp. CS20 TaxID=2775246 RepID=UPI001B3A1F52|nr:mechanosensitive ion channel domain-containing protein [Flavobacterium sp. CS20]QTY27736.1 mechanosensitive ion channel family protein [Flavobacterium sp. CS20]
MKPQTPIHFVYDIIKSNTDFNDTYLLILNALVNTIILVILSYLLYRILRGVGLNLVNRFAKKSKTHFDDLLVQNKTFVNLSNLLVFYIISAFTDELYIDFPVFENVVSKIVQIFLVVFTIWTIRSFLKTIKDYLKTLDNFKDKPIESYIQVFMILLWIIGIIIIFSIVTGKPLMKFLIGLGTVSAVILLVFKDTILGFVASIQVATNDTVRIGDWITMEKYGADGDVFEINLASVKVRNFDKTITTIPTYYLISDSFKNWRGMSESGGRRIKRAIIIKANSIKFVDEDLFQKLKGIQLISDYIEHRQADIDDYNKSNNIDKSLTINGRNQTNFGVFRKYIDEYLHQNSAVSDDMTIMTRQLAPTAQGVPLEIYCFSVDKIWKNYEYIIADIFDHLLASIPYFELEAFELPSGKDLDLIKT